MKFTTVFCLVVVLVCLDFSAAWFGGGSKSKSNDNGGKKERGVFGKAYDKVKSAGKFAADAVRGTASMGKAYKWVIGFQWGFFSHRVPHVASKCHGILKYLANSI